MKARIIFVIFLTLWSAGRALAWGRLGHQAIGELAADLLHEKARLQVKKILGSGDLASAGAWLDELRAAERGTGALAGDAEAAAFNQKFPDNHKWHFTNLPLGSGSYSESSRFAEADDVVHQINACIAALEGRPTKFTPEQALRVLVHLVGDVHQPLHVGTGFFDVRNPEAPKLVTAPSSVAGKSADLGGNKVRTGFGPFDSLHAYWDDTLVQRVAATGNAEKLAAHLRSRVNHTKWRTSGDYHAWAAVWATDTVHQTALAYKGIVFTGAKLSASKSLQAIAAELPSDYEAVQKPRAQTQLAKAAFHLAELLNAIEWKVP